MISWSKRAVVAYTPPLGAPPPPALPDVMWTATGDGGVLLEAFAWTAPVPELGARPVVHRLEVRRHERPRSVGLMPIEAQPPSLLELQALVDVALPSAAATGRPAPILALLFLSNGPDAEYPEARGFYSVTLHMTGVSMPARPQELAGSGRPA